MDKKELNKELINCLEKRSNLRREIRELYEDIEELNAELYKKISRVVEARVELENLAEKKTLENGLGKLKKLTFNRTIRN